jgi:hypothetical protein
MFLFVKDIPPLVDIIPLRVENRVRPSKPNSDRFRPRGETCVLREDASEVGRYRPWSEPRSVQ